MPPLRDTPGGEEGPDIAPPGEGFELYRHKNAGANAGVTASGWHGLYWARKREDGDYDLRSVPTSLGEPSAQGGVMPGKGFERLYEKVER